ncbi:MAG: ABC transporter ATP-binding protein [Clostridia bacterium]|nr:ABC transporter ATP-binding protein [Clostridia bacterium]
MDELRIRSLCAGYGGRKVIDGAELTVRAGEVCALLGLNGSGKSTLLRAAMGLLPVSEGGVFLGERDLLAMGARERARHCAYIPQRSRMDGGITALEAVLMGANASTPLFSGYSAAQRERAKSCLDEMGALAWAETPVGALSEGQRQTVVFARAIMQRASVLLLDEPDGALDLPRRGAMMEAVRRMAGAGPCAALVALHDASLALSRCDRVLILMGGRIAFDLDMRCAGEEQVERALCALYGPVDIVRRGRRFAVLG